MQKLLRLTAFSFSLFSLFVFFGCAPKEPDVGQDPQKFQIIASFYPLAYFAEQIGGEFVQVENLSGEKDLHDFEITPKDLSKMEKANLVILQGGGMESWRTETTKALRDNGVKVFVVEEHITFFSNNNEEEGHEHEEEGHHHHGEFNPHTWLSPMLSDQVSAFILAELIALDPEHKEEYEKNAKILSDKFRAIDAEARTSFTSCSKKTAVVGHDAFLYFANAYGFTTLPLSGISTSDSPSAKKMSEAKTFLESEGIRYILGEQNETNSFSETLAKESGVQILLLDPIEKTIENENYFSRMQENIKIFHTALECQSL
jgi:zinc transport system substrate-binding protein